MILELVYAFIVLLLTWFILVKLMKGNNKAPPGPFQWPILGNIVQMGLNKHKLPHLILADLAEEYGEVMSLKLGVHNAVVLSSFEVMKTLLVAEEFSYTRFVGFPFVHDRSGGEDLGLIFGVGKTWKEVRRFTLKGLRDFGFGKVNSMEAIMTDELNELMLHLKKSVNAARTLLYEWMSFSHLDDPELARLVDINDRIDRSVTMEKPSVVFPIVRHLAPKASGHTELLQLFEDQKAFLRKFIAEHRKLLAKLDEPQNFIQVFVDAVNKNKGKAFTDEQLLIILADLFIAGSGTTSKTLSYSILFMLLNPDVQKRVQEEISNVVPSGQFPTLADSEKMPFTKATILEVMRLGDIVPLPPARGLTADFAYKNFIIPKGSAILFNMHPVFMDKSYWGDPEVFRPDRFLDESMNIVNIERMTPFGFGSRVCFGESLARNSIFIYFTTFLQNFEFNKVPNTPDPSIVPKLNVIMGPYPYDVLVKPRT